MAAALDPATNTNSGTLSNGNLTYAATSASGNVVRSDTFTSTRKFYFEYTMSTVGNSGNQGVGVVQSTQATVTPTSVGTVPSGMWEWRSDAVTINSGSSTSVGTAAANGDVIMVACDPVGGKVWFGKNGTWFGSGNPGAGTGAQYTGLTGSMGALINMFATGGSPVGTMNFGPNYTYLAPAGFGSLLAIATSMATTAGSYAITGAAPRIGKLYTLITAAGAYAISGAVANIRRAVKHTPGSYAVTGAAATVNKALHMVTSAGSYLLTGAGANKFLKIKFSPGSYTITGKALIEAKLPGAANLIRQAKFVLQKLRVTAPTLDQ